MDTITQAALGAAVGEAVLGKQLGNKAVLWGTALAVLPDLDVLANPLLDAITQLSWHRGISHSILLTAALTPLFGWLITRVHKKATNFARASLLAFLAIGTHILLDCFTTYGTQVFAPFSMYQVSWDSIFIIDPVYTIPLLAGVFIAVFHRKDHPRRRAANAVGLIVSTAYLLSTTGVKAYVKGHFDAGLEARGITATRMATAPTAFNVILWRAIVETDSGYHIGYYSLLDGRNKPEFFFIPRNDRLLETIKGERATQALVWFSNGYYTVKKSGEDFLFSDLRFGEFTTDPGKRNFGLDKTENHSFSFTFKLLKEKEGWTVERMPFSIPWDRRPFEDLWKRIKGKRGG